MPGLTGSFENRRAPAGCGLLNWAVRCRPTGCADSINGNVAQGSTVVTDDWNSYRAVVALGAGSAARTSTVCFPAFTTSHLWSSAGCCPPARAHPIVSIWLRASTSSASGSTGVISRSCGLVFLRVFELATELGPCAIGRWSSGPCQGACHRIPRVFRPARGLVSVVARGCEGECGGSTVTISEERYGDHVADVVCAYRQNEIGGAPDSAAR